MSDGDDFATLEQYRRLAAEVDRVKVKASADGQRFTAFHRKDFAELAGEVGHLHRIVKKLVESHNPDGQPDWMGNRDPAKARQMLGETWQWVEDVARPYGLDVELCWPWHRGGVGVLLYARQHYYAALRGSREESVTDFLTRHLEAVERRVKRLTAAAGCNGTEHHPGQEREGFAFDPYAPGVLERLAAWYAEGAPGHPPGLSDIPIGGGV